MKKLLIKYGLSSFKDWLQFIGGIIAISFVVSLAYAIFDFIWSDEYDFFSIKITISILVLLLINIFIDEVHKKLNE